MSELLIQLRNSQQWLKVLLKTENLLKGVTYGQLVEKLADIGISDTKVNIRNKLSRRKFSAAFFLQCLEVIGVQQVHLDR